jgi:hypothetical protein
MVSSNSSYVYFTSYINNYYNLVIPDEDFRLIKSHFDFTGIFFLQSELSGVSSFKFLLIRKINQTLMSSPH